MVKNIGDRVLEGLQLNGLGRFVGASLMDMTFTGAKRLTNHEHKYYLKHSQYS